MSTVIFKSKWAFAGPVVGAVLLGGCGGGDSSVNSVTSYRFKEVNRFVMDVASNTLDKTARRVFTYKDVSTPDQVLHYSGPGPNTVWGDADDALGYYISCDFSGKAETAKTVFDLETELHVGLADLYASHPELSASVTRDDAATSCATNYNGQGRLVMKVFSGPGSNGIWRDGDDPLLYSVTWKQPVSVADASVVVDAPGVAGYAGSTLTNYYYSAGGGAERDLVRSGAYIKYTYSTSKALTRISRLSQGSNPKTWPGPQPSDVLQTYTDYEYKSGSVQKCTRNAAGVATAVEYDTYTSEGFLNQRQFKNAGIDGIFCNADDKLITADGYTVESV